MFRFLSRFLGVWLVAAALVAATVDGAKSIAASSLVLTPFGETWGALAAMAQSGAEGSDAAALSWPLDVALAWLLSAPTVAVLAALSFLFLAAGRRRRRALIGHEFAT
jgi:hypothetical protein